MIIALVIVKILLGIAAYFIRNLLRQVEQLEENADQLEKRDEQYTEWFLNFKKEVELASSRLKQVDRKGSFEADDEIGFMFKEIKKIQGRLKMYQP